MTKKSIIGLAMTVLLLGGSLPARAIEITRNSGADADPLNAVTINSVTIDNVADTITIDVDIEKLHSPFEIGFTVTSDGGTALVPDTATYRVIVKTKLATTGNPAHEMNGFDIDLETPALDPFVSLDGDNATSTVFAVMHPNLASGFRFGGLNGGGPTIAQGGSASSELDLVAVSFKPAGESHSFTLKFTANPEPTSLLLGALVVGPCGIGLVRRRRKKKLNKQTAA